MLLLMDIRRDIMRIVLLLLPLFLLGCQKANESIKTHYVDNKHKKLESVKKEVIKLKKSS